jgi:hypothetical protein
MSILKPIEDELSEKLQVEQAEEDALVEAIVSDVAGMMAASVVSAKWECVLADLVPLVVDGKLGRVAEILKIYWPPDAEIEALRVCGLEEAKV